MGIIKGYRRIRTWGLYRDRMESQMDKKMENHMSHSLNS